MNRIARSTLALSAIAAVAMGATACSSGTETEAAADGVTTLTVATGASPKPYTFLDENDELTGYDIEILRAVDEKLPEIEFKFEVVDFPQLFAGLDSGLYNIVANNLSATEERREKYDFATPTIEAQFGIVTKDDSQNITRLDDLAGKRTYGEPGLNFTRVLEQYNEQNPGKEIKIEYTELDTQTQYKNLATGGIDFIFNERVVYNELGGPDTALKLNFTELDGAYLSDTFGTNLYSAFAFSKRTKNVDDIVEQVNGAIAELDADGTLAKLSDEFFGYDVTPKNVK
ncbi:transporter substrate-binding domain-containing protein [Leucobacter sp. 1207-22]|uniref:transporter substrate-binding domain-containing protein n=1 Tax=Leucobacter sp. 1207-22 TaxID=2604456 RepID=UPI004063D65B